MLSELWATWLTGPLMYPDVSFQPRQASEPVPPGDAAPQVEAVGGRAGDEVASWASGGREEPQPGNPDREEQAEVGSPGGLRRQGETSGTGQSSGGFFISKPKAFCSSFSLLCFSAGWCEIFLNDPHRFDSFFEMISIPSKIRPISIIICFWKWLKIFEDDPNFPKFQQRTPILWSRILSYKPQSVFVSLRTFNFLVLIFRVSVNDYSSAWELTTIFPFHDFSN